MASLVDSLIVQHGFDSERVYVAGISAGAGLTARCSRCVIPSASPRSRCIRAPLSAKPAPASRRWT